MVIKRILNVVSNKLIQKNIKRVVPLIAGIATASENPGNFVINMIRNFSTSFSGSSIPIEGTSAQLLAAQAGQAIATTLPAATNGNFTTTFVNYMASGVSTGIKYIISAPIHIAANIMYHVPVAIYKGVTLAPIKTDVITNGSDVIIFVGRHPQTQELTIRAGEALITIIKIAIVKGIISIIIIYITIRITYYCMTKLINIINSNQKNKNGNESFIPVDDGTY